MQIQMLLTFDWCTASTTSRTCSQLKLPEQWLSGGVITVTNNCENILIIIFLIITHCSRLWRSLARFWVSVLQVTLTSLFNSEASQAGFITGKTINMFCGNFNVSSNFRAPGAPDNNSFRYVWHCFPTGGSQPKSGSRSGFDCFVGSLSLFFSSYSISFLLKINKQTKKQGFNGEKVEYSSYRTQFNSIIYIPGMIESGLAFLSSWNRFERRCVNLMRGLWGEGGNVM